ncbi:carbohydrate deacetylase [Boleophthalmus pectinirostris]|uniref:carbohydrate deacetylase n=1 Tax=Boleophthalmus pectinirostris TaxID=150288 RepID=UPI00242D309E|nr:carbohydrate deacetylase [Boleophthalmus pectinirostris]
MPQSRMQLVVTGDDFGYCPRRNQGLVECFLSGAITTVSLLVNGSAAQQAAELAKRHSIPIGLHANLSEGVPVCPSLLQSSLVDHRGFFHGKMGFRRRLERGQLCLTQVEMELRAQVKRFIELTGHRPQHMDGHQHVHVLPGVRLVFAQVLSDLSIPFTRVPVEPGLHSCPWLQAPLRTFYSQVEQDALDSIPVFRKYSLRWPDVYLGLTTMGQNMSVSSLQRALSHALSTESSDSTPRERPLSAELMVHPGYPSLPEEGGCGEGPDDFSQSSERQHELQVLTDPALSAVYQSQRVQLCTFKELHTST